MINPIQSAKQEIQALIHAAALAALGEAYGFTVETVPTVCFAGEPVSSQAIIKAIEATI